MPTSYTHRLGLPLLVLLLGIVSPTAFASTVTKTVATPAATMTPTAHLSAIQTRGNTDISNRITSLQSLITKVSAAKKLSSQQQSDLVAEMQGEVSGLTTLKTSLDGETSVDAAKIDFQNIFAEHYIYAFYLPRVDRIVAADNQVDAATLLLGIVPKLQGYITQAGQQGKAITVPTQELADLQAKATDAQTQSQSVITSLTPLLASGYPGNKGTVESASTPLKTGRTDLTTARSDATLIINALKKDLPSVQ